MRIKLFLFLHYLDASSDDDEYQLSENVEKTADNGTDNDEDGNDDEEMDAVENGLNWRDNLAQKARAAYLERQSNTQNLMKIVYGAINAVNIFFSSILIKSRFKSEKNEKYS